VLDELVPSVESVVVVDVVFVEEEVLRYFAASMRIPAALFFNASKVEPLFAAPEVVIVCIVSSWLSTAEDTSEVLSKPSPSVSNSENWSSETSDTSSLVRYPSLSESRFSKSREATFEAAEDVLIEMFDEYAFKIVLADIISIFAVSFLRSNTPFHDYIVKRSRNVSYYFLFLDT
jgi:hypothetical protein